MLKMTASGHFEALSKQMSNPLSETLMEDIKHSYMFVVDSIGQKLAVGQGRDADLGKTTERLGQEAWVLVQGSKFVVPSELCYDLEEDTHHGGLHLTNMQSHACIHRHCDDVAMHLCLPFMHICQAIKVERFVKHLHSTDRIMSKT